MTEIWTADWIFHDSSGTDFVAKGVVTKRIPERFVLNEGLSYYRALKGMLVNSPSITNFLSRLSHDRVTKLKKFKIIYKKKIGITNYQNNYE